MIKILILEDNPLKADAIFNVVNQLGGCTFEIAPDVVTARRIMIKEFDLLILDMNLPERFSEIPKKNIGLKFVEELKSSNRLKLPKHIIGLTEYDNIIKEFKDRFSKLAIILIKYDLTSNMWQETLNEKLSDLIQGERQSLNDSDYDYDIAFITALRTPEFEAILDLEFNWQKIKIANDSSIYYAGKTLTKSNASLNVVATYLPQMGMVATAASVTKLIQTFRPKYVIMTGICGGIKGKVNLGDVIISDLSFDLGSGKIKQDINGIEIFEPDFKSIPLSNNLKEELIDFTSNKKCLREIKDLWKGENIHQEINLHVGPMGSSAAVIESNMYANKIIAHQRKLLAIDMETYSIFYCCQFANKPQPIALSIKTVCDFADNDKNDSIQKYGSFVSAEISNYIIREIIQF